MKKGREIIHTVYLTAKSVKGASLALQCVHHIHGGDGLPLGVLSVGDGVTNDVF